MRIILLLLLCFSLCGCATYQYVHYPEKTQEELNRDSYDCQTTASQVAADKSMTGNYFYIPYEYDRCMQQKYGYIKQANK